MMCKCKATYENYTKTLTHTLNNGSKSENFARHAIRSPYPIDQWTHSLTHICICIHRTRPCNFRTVAIYFIAACDQSFHHQQTFMSASFTFWFHLIELKLLFIYFDIRRELSHSLKLSFNIGMYLCVRKLAIAHSICANVCETISICTSASLFESQTVDLHPELFSPLFTVHWARWRVTQVWISFNHTQFCSASYEWMTTMRFKFKWCILCCRCMCRWETTVSFTVIWFHISLLSFFPFALTNAVLFEMRRKMIPSTVMHPNVKWFCLFSNHLAVVP